MNIEQKIEAILFWKGEPMRIAKLAEMLGIDFVACEQAIERLQALLHDRAVTIVRAGDTVAIGTKGAFSELIEQLTKEELSRDLGKAGTETLSIILYEGPISRSEIDHIRGVNSQFILRNLLIRGLVDRIEDAKDARVFLYKSSMNLLAHLGIGKIEDMPEYESVRKDIETFRQSTINDGISGDTMNSNVEKQSSDR
ncbi:MAG: SMC-Scp complex subunit ScpB [Patescibacteria group bacterium]|nr:SMC-Scp complex subunit ScpB [Patescibacteria group bacterium]